MKTISGLLLFSLALFLVLWIGNLHPILQESNDPDSVGPKLAGVANNPALVPREGVPADDGTKTVEPKRVPLGEIFSTSGQKELNKNLRTIERPISQGKNKLYDTLLAGRGPPTAFLARGDDIGTAVDATVAVFCHGFPVDEPVSAYERPNSDQLWLVVFLGVEGSGLAWLVQSAQISRKEIRLVYKKHFALGDDIHPCFYWVPLSVLEPDNYNVQLFNEDQKQVVFSRRVKVFRK